MKICEVMLTFAGSLLLSQILVCQGDAQLPDGGTIKVIVHTEEVGNAAGGIQGAVGGIGGAVGGIGGAVGGGLGGGVQGVLAGDIQTDLNGPKDGPFTAEVDGNIGKDMSMELDALARFLGLKAGAGARAFGPDSLAAVGANIGKMKAGVAAFGKRGMVSIVLGDNRFDIVGPKGLIHKDTVSQEAPNERYLKKLFGRK